jgi:hypothetical protein
MGPKAITTNFLNVGLASIFFCLLHTQYAAKSQKALQSGVN